MSLKKTQQQVKNRLLEYKNSNYTTHLYSFVHVGHAVVFYYYPIFKNKTIPPIRMIICKDTVLVGVKPFTKDFLRDDFFHTLDECFAKLETLALLS